MCDEIAAITGNEISSVYVRDDDRLIMRGNSGFGPAAIGTTLQIGEGITGLVAECMRPVSAAHAASEAAYKPIPGLGEERFPVFVGIPLISTGAVIGVLVLQRRTTVFTTAEVTLATALGAPVTLALERRLATAVRSARLIGRGHVEGAVLGRTCVVPTTTALTAVNVDLDRAFGRLRSDLGRATRRLSGYLVGSHDPIIGGALDRLALTLCDARLREQLVAAAMRGEGPHAVAKQYARAPYRLGTVDESSERVAEIEELCVLLGDPRALRPGSVWIADRIGSFVALAAVARGASALVASAEVTSSAIAILRAAAIPLVSEVSGLFSWARPGDLLAVDGESGSVFVHPAPTDIERMRQARQRAE